jgi:hypothetical protein
MGVKHTHYAILSSLLYFKNMLWIIPISAVWFGSDAFPESTHYWGGFIFENLSSTVLSWEELYLHPPCISSVLKYRDWGSYIIESFSNPSEYYDFLLKYCLLDLLRCRI